MRWRELLATEAPAATILIRLLVGAVFLPEGIMKLVFPAWLGAGRFAEIAMPFPQLTGPFVGAAEMTCGLLILLGLFTRAAAIPLIITMIMAILATKIPVLLGHDWWIFELEETSRYGIWGFEHEWRADFSMLMGSLYLLIVGAGRWSLDALWLSKSAARAQSYND